METIWHRGSMHEKGLDLKKIHGDMLVTFGDNVPALSPIQLRLGGGVGQKGNLEGDPKSTIATTDQKRTRLTTLRENLILI